MTKNVEEEIISIIADVSGFDEGEIGLHSHLINDLEMDSIKAIEIAVAIEKKFKVSIRDEDLPKITTPLQIITLVETALSQQGKA
jgi:acyl carrier protein